MRKNTKIDKVNFNNIEEVKKCAMALSEEDYKLFINEYVHDLMNTTDYNFRNTIAMVLSDLHCNEAIEPLIALVNDSKTENCRGTLVYSINDIMLHKLALIMLVLFLVFNIVFK